MSSVSRLILAQGELEAQRRRERADFLGGSIAGVGQAVGGYLQQRDEQRRLGERDGAWARFVESGEWQKDPQAALQTSVSIWGPRDGPKMAEALFSFAKVAQGQIQSPEEARTEVGKVASALLKMTPPLRARWWPQLSQAAKPLGLDLGEAYDPETHDPEIASIAEAFGPKEKRELLQVDPTKGLYDTTEQRYVLEPKAEAPTPPQPRVVGRSLVTNEGKVLYRDPESQSSDGTWIMRNGQPAYVGKSDIRPGDQPYESPRSGVKKIPAGVAQDLADMNTSIDEAMALGKTLPGQIGAASWAGAQVPDILTSTTGIGEQSKITQAEIDKVKQIIGKALEGGVLRKEDEVKYAKILPKIGDSEAVARAKVQGLIETISKKRQRQLESLTDAGYDLSGYQEPESQGGGWQERPGGIRIRLKPGQ